MKKQLLTILALLLALSLAVACGPAPALSTTSTAAPTAEPSAKPTAAPPAKSGSTVSFTNDYGTASTKCAHAGCSNYIASSGDTNCCVTHSKKCAECGCYIDEDATWCMDCLTESLSSSSSSSSSSYSSSSSSSSSSSETYWCMGKNDTCSNKTSSAYDFYCSQCDPNGDNKEG